MSVRYNIDNDKIELFLENDYEIKEVINSFNAAVEEITYPRPILVNAMNSQELKPIDELKQVALAISSKKELIIPKLAIAVSEIARYGIGRQIGAFYQLNGIDSKPFYGRNDALLWLFDLQEQA